MTLYYNNARKELLHRNKLGIADWTGRKKVAEISQLKVDLLHKRHFALDDVFEPLLAKTTLAGSEARYTIHS